MKNLHPQTKFKVYGRTIVCDKKIANIIKTLNQHGCETHLSCQDNNGAVWIDFSVEGAQQFLSIINHHQYFNPYIQKFDGWLRQQKWQYCWQPNGHYAQDRKTFIPYGGIIHSVSLRFPKEHLSCFRKYFNAVFKGEYEEK
jgi:hypothetical protein